MGFGRAKMNDLLRPSTFMLKYYMLSGLKPTSGCYSRAERGYSQNRIE